MDPRTLVMDALADPSITTILADPTSTPFSVHKALLYKQSLYFRSAYDSGLKEAEEHRFHLSDVPDSLIRTFTLWLYTGEIHVNNNAESPVPLSLSSIPKGEWIVEAERLSREQQELPFELDDENYDEDENAHEGGQDAAADHYSEEGGSATSSMVDIDDARHVLREISNMAGGTVEEGLVHQVFGEDTEPSKLDHYQLQVLLQLYEDDEEFTEQCAKWRDSLEAMEPEEGDLESNVFPRAKDPTALSSLIHLYILADRLGVHALQIAVVNHLQHERHRLESLRLDSFPSFDDVAAAFDNLPEKSPLRTWLIDVFAYDWNPAADDEAQVAAREHLPRDFLMGVMLVNTQRLNRNATLNIAPFEYDLCHYHSHLTWEEEGACREARGSKQMSKDVHAAKDRQIILRHAQDKTVT